MSSAPQPAAGSPLGVDLILILSAENSFAVQPDQQGVTCPRVSLTRINDRGDLRSLVKLHVKRDFKLDVEYLGAIDLVETGLQPILVVVAMVTTLPAGCPLRKLTLSAIRSGDNEVPYQEHFETAVRWREASILAPRLRQDIDRATQLANDLLAKTRVEENGHWGWDQYLRGEPLGILSTANGILACLYSGVPGSRRMIDQPLASLRTLQSPAGGWQVKRSLVGSQSDTLITESTCCCLLALYEAGHQSTEDPSVQRGIEWLRMQQREDNGWSSAEVGDRSLVFPTALAVRVLALYEQGDAVQGGVEWLRRARCGDGGWGATASTEHEPVPSSPAYTAAVISAFMAAGVSRGDNAVVGGCDYLHRTFNPASPEPWEPTSFSSVVDRERWARLDYRHFATGYALAALCEAGDDLSKPTVLSATRLLLALQSNEGAFRCALTMPDAKPVWAVFGAVYALRRVLDSSARELAPLIRNEQLTQDLEVTARVAGQRSSIAEHKGGSALRERMLVAWLCALTFALIAVLLVSSGAFGKISGSALTKAGVGLLTFIGTLITAIAPTLITEVVKRRKGDRQ